MKCCNVLIICMLKCSRLTPCGMYLLLKSYAFALTLCPSSGFQQFWGNLNSVSPKNCLYSSASYTYTQRRCNAAPDITNLSGCSSTCVFTEKKAIRLELGFMGYLAVMGAQKQGFTWGEKWWVGVKRRTDLPAYNDGCLPLPKNFPYSCQFFLRMLWAVCTPLTTPHNPYRLACFELVSMFEALWLN